MRLDTSWYTSIIYPSHPKRASAGGAYWHFWKRTIPWNVRGVSSPQPTKLSLSLSQHVMQSSSLSHVASVDMSWHICQGHFRYLLEQCQKRFWQSSHWIFWILIEINIFIFFVIPKIQWFCIQALSATWPPAPQVNDSARVECIVVFCCHPDARIKIVSSNPA